MAAGYGSSPFPCFPNVRIFLLLPPFPYPPIANCLCRLSSLPSHTILVPHCDGVMVRGLPLVGFAVCMIGACRLVAGCSWLMRECLAWLCHGHHLAIHTMLHRGAPCPTEIVDCMLVLWSSMQLDSIPAGQPASLAALSKLAS